MSKEYGWLKEYREHFAQLAEDAPKPNFRHGLNIRIQPRTFDESNLNSREHEVDVKVDGPQDGVVFVSHPELSVDILDETEIRPFFDHDWVPEKEQHSVFCRHQALANLFAVVKVSQGAVLEEPISLDIMAERGNLYLTVLILAEANSQAKFILSKQSRSSDEDVFVSEDVRIIAKPGSRLTFVGTQRHSTSDIIFQSRKARVQKDARVEWLDLNLGGHYSQLDAISLLEGEGAETDNTALFLASDDQRTSIYTDSTHRAKNTYSNIVTKGVIGGSAKALSRGLVKIEENAWGSNGYEQQDALLLSETAEADAIPNLEIHNHDVKCSHGSTVGQVDAEVLFYLMSRGIDRKRAEQEIVKGYFEPILAKIKGKGVAEMIQARLAAMNVDG